MSQLFGIDLTPSNVFSALTSLQKVSDRLRRQSDPRAVFPDVYAIITRRVAVEVAKGKDSCFLEPAWIARLAGLFAVRYFESLTASLDALAQPSNAWRLAYSYAAARITLPTQDALLGINAHINFDLAQGIYDNIVEAGATENEQLLERYHHDHDTVNQILEAAIPECLDLLAERYACPLARIVVSNDSIKSAACHLTLAMLKLWRDRVWGDVRSLLAAQQESERAAIIARTNRDSGLIAGFIGLASTILGERRRPLPRNPQQVRPHSASSFPLLQSTFAQAA